MQSNEGPHILDWISETSERNLYHKLSKGGKNARVAIGHEYNGKNPMRPKTQSSQD